MPKWPTDIFANLHHLLDSEMLFSDADYYTYSTMKHLIQKNMQTPFFSLYQDMSEIPAQYFEWNNSFEFVRDN